MAILSSAPVSSTGIWVDGTDGRELCDVASVAAPQVVGVTALLLVWGRTADEVEDVLFATTVDFSGDVRQGGGLVDALAVVTSPVGSRQLASAA
jgi:hypothetical protein